MTEIDDARALYEAAREAAEQGRDGEAIRGFAEIVERWGASEDQWLRWLVGEALYGEALSLERVEREERAIQLYSQIIDRFDGVDDDELRGQVARALYHQGVDLARLDRTDEALAAWDGIIARYGSSEEPALVGRVASAFERKAGAYRRLEQLDEALAAYDEIVLRWSESPWPGMRRRADMALSNKAFVLLLQNRLDEAIVVANGAIGRLGESEDPTALAIAVLNLGSALAREQRFDEALGVYDLLIERLETGPGFEAPAIRAQLILAISNKVEVLMVVDRGDEAGALHAELLDRFGLEVARAFADAAARNEHDEGAGPVVAGLMLKQILVLAELGRADEARVTLDYLIERFTGANNPEIERFMSVARELREQLRDDRPDG